MPIVRWNGHDHGLDRNLSRLPRPLRTAVIETPVVESGSVAVDAPPVADDPVAQALPVSRSGLPPVARQCLVLLLIGFLALQALLTSRQTSPAYDEVSLVPAGYVLLKTGQWHNLFPHHPPLIGALSALPLLVLNPRLDANDPWLKRNPTNPWNVGENFLALNNDDDRIFAWGRIPVLLLSLLLAFLVYRWARELYGDAAGLMALGLYCFCPTTVAFSSFASLDIGVSFFVTLSAFCFWRYVSSQGGAHYLLWTGLALGCALTSKTTAVVLPPVFVLLALLAVWRPPAPGQSLRARLTSGTNALALVFAVAAAVVYTIYLFPSDPLFYVKAVLLAPTLRGDNDLYFLMGQSRLWGFWYYFPVAYLIKTPVPMLLLLPLACWHWYKRGGGWFREAFVLLPGLAYFGLISALAPDIGIRYLIPAFPLLFIFVSRTAPLFTKSRVGAIAGIALAVWYLSTPVRFFPDYLSYFNELVGGPRHGIEYLDDSNVEWGHQLKRIKRYLDEHPEDRPKLLYFTTGRPDYYGIRAPWMQAAEITRPQPGVYIIGANDLVRIKQGFGVDWLKRYPVKDVIGYSVFVFKVP
jgi:4-amino-4-deoxy-L-arabinose transferase-like glycosyltransferase